MPQREPYSVLVAAVLSTRTQDTVTAQAAARLFQAAPTPGDLARLRADRIARLIYPVGFYRTKARLLPKLAQRLVALGRVPANKAELLLLPGVGPKVANIVLANAFGQDAIAVDTHVHRISNRLGLVNTNTPQATEQALQQVLPRRRWREWNYLLVALGQTICRPVNPKCDECPVAALCCRVGVRARVQRERPDRPAERPGYRPQYDGAAESRQPRSRQQSAQAAGQSRA